ncbi:MAG: L,D-transpeptidase Cds6 family protein [Silvanigrellaceae bacterium]
MLNKDTTQNTQPNRENGSRVVFKSLSIMASLFLAGTSAAEPASQHPANGNGNGAGLPKSKVITGAVPVANSESAQNDKTETKNSEMEASAVQPSASAPTKAPTNIPVNTTSESNNSTKSVVQVPVAAGPDKPIGHSLKTPEAQKRIEMMMANAHQDGKIGQLVAAPAPVKGTAPLVNGKYGFSANGTFQGVPKALVSLGSNTPAYALVVEKLHHRMSLFRLNEGGKYEMLKTYRAISGRDPGDKVSRGDLRTPEGIYFITGRLSDDSLPPKYGRMAFTLDYPNIYDKRQRKSGYGIWIHSTDDPNRLQKPFDTEGCVVLSNEDITDLEKYITFFEVPVVITKEMTSVNEDELVPTRKKALEMVDAWKKSWESSSFESYMSYYSKNFRSLGKNKDQWENFKARLSTERGTDIHVTISEPKIVAFEDQLLVVFLQDYQSKQHSDFGRKFLYLQWEGDRYRIIAEKWYKAPRSETALRALKTQNNQL